MLCFLINLNFYKIMVDFLDKLSYNSKGDYFVNLEQINLGGIGMVILDIMLDNFYSFKDFHMNLTYPKKIVGSSINNEHLSERPNFRYKKVNIIMGANASGKTTLGRTLMKIFNFIDKKNYEIITEIIADNSKEASFTLDMATTEKTFYRISCTVTPKENGIYNPEDIKLVVQSNKINLKDSYESCVERIKMKEICSEDNYLVELEKISGLDWLFEYPEDTDRILRLPKKDSKFKLVLENILKALDPSIQKIEKLRGVENAYVIRLQNSDVILKDGDRFNTNVLSSGTKAGVEIARVVSALLHERNTFYYCDEKFPYIHSDIEKSKI